MRRIWKINLRSNSAVSSFQFRVSNSSLFDFGSAGSAKTVGKFDRIPLHPHPRSVSEAEMIEEMMQIAETQVTRIHQLRGYL